MPVLEAQDFRRGWPKILSTKKRCCRSGEQRQKSSRNTGAAQPIRSLVKHGTRKTFCMLQAAGVL